MIIKETAFIVIGGIFGKSNMAIGFKTNTGTTIYNTMDKDYPKEKAIEVSYKYLIKNYGE